jgi:hypothetical protein
MKNLLSPSCIQSTRTIRVAPLIALFVLLGSSGSRMLAQPIAIARPSLTAGWATFGEALPPGQAIDGLQIGTLPTQTDVKSRWPDGSIKFAIVSASIPTAGSYAVTAASFPGGRFTPVVPTASVTLNIGGTIYTATLPATPAGDTWMSGPIVQEWRHVIAPIAGGTAHPFVRVIFDTRVYNDGRSHLSVTVENVLNQTGATTTTYDVTIVANGQTRFTHAQVQHYYMTRWRKAYDLDFVPSTVTPDVTPFNASRAIPPFNAVVNLDGRVDTIGANFDILQSGALDNIMGGHGGRAELAPLPDWTARYLVKKNATQGQFVMANADLAGSWPIHVREPDGAALSGLGSEHLMSIDQEPNVWLAAGGTGIKGSPMPMAEYGSGVPGPGQSPLGPSNAHVPDLAFVPYLLTGDRYYAEEMAFWANHGMLATLGHSAQGLLKGNEVRGVGWVLRNMAEAAAYYPDASPVKGYLAQKVVNNLNWLDSYAKGLKTPDNPLWTVYAWTRYDRPEGPQYFAHWENNYLAYGIDRAVKLGFATDNAYRDAANDLQLRFFTSEPDYPRFEGAPYAIPYGTLSGSTVTFFTTMAQFKPGGVANHRDFAGYYGPEARLSIMEARERGGTGAQAAYDYLWPYIGTAASYCPTNGSNNLPFLACRAGFALDPYPPTDTPPPPPPPPPVPTATLSASPASITSGQSATLTWSTTNTETVTIDQGIGAVTASGNRSVSPSATTTYTLTATNSGGSATATATVTVTAVTDTTPPTITSITPAAGATGVSTATSVTATFSEAMNAATLTTTTFALRDAAGASVPATLSYNTSTRVATVKPSQVLSASTAYTATVSGGSGGVTDVAGNALAANVAWSFTTGAAPPAVVTIWSASAAPAAIATNDGSAVELGVKFRSDVAGNVTGVRFYKGKTTTGTHTGTLWSNTGVKLATATFTGETASGWQQVSFATPVTIAANTVYVVSYHTNVGNYAYTSAYFASRGVDTPPLHALANGVSGGNGVYRYGATAFPNSTFNSNNYWVDVVFVPR